MATFHNSRLPTVVMAIVSSLLLTACATGKSYKTYDDYNPNINFSGYQTFSFISDNPMIVSSAQGAVSPLLQGRIMNAIRADLSRKGFRYVTDPESADMALSFTVGARDQIRVDQYPASYRTGYGSYYRGYGYGMNYGTEPASASTQRASWPLMSSTFAAKLRRFMAPPARASTARTGKTWKNSSTTSS